MLVRSPVIPEGQENIGSRDVFDRFAAHAGFVHHVTDADCWTQNGSTHAHVFRDFHTSICEKQKHIWTEKQPCVYFGVVFVCLLLSSLFAGFC